MKKIKYPNLKDGNLNSGKEHKCSHCGKVDKEFFMKTDPETSKWYDSACYMEWEAYGGLPELPTTSQNQERIKELERQVAELQKQVKELQENQLINQQQVKDKK